MTADRVVRHNRIDLALHHLRTARDDTAPSLLVLHGLGEASPTTAPDWSEPWPGAVWALDFTGHGESAVPLGGGYSAELLMGDADAALSVIGPSAVVGFGLGAYVALLIAGGRPKLVRGAVLLDGPGLAGGSTHPTSSTVFHLPPETLTGTAPDPWALLEMAQDLRPPDYAATFARLALQQSGLDEPILVCVRARAMWVDAIKDEPGVVSGIDLDTAISRLVRQPA
jgi:pimeloyl-ACP methyl ester carboxylesterase